MVKSKTRQAKSIRQVFLKKPLFYVALFSLILIFLVVFHKTAQAVLGDGSGVAEFSSSSNSLQAGDIGSLNLIFTATDIVKTNGRIRLKDPSFHSRPFRLSEGDLTLTSTNPDVGLAVSSGGYCPSYTYIKITSGQLEAGDQVVLTFGNLDAPIKAYQSIEVETSTDADGNGTFAPIEIQPRFDILPNPEPDLIVATGPTYVQAGTPFILKVRYLDKFGNPNTNFSDSLSFTSSDILADLPEAESLFPSGQGVHEFSVTLNTLGIQYVYIDGQLTTNSNPFVVVESLADHSQIYWGDLHGHHGHVYTISDQRVDEYMEYARDVSDLDFTSQSSKSSINYCTADEVQAEVENSVYQYNDPGNFITIRSYEWNSSPGGDGHHNVYFSGSTTGSAIYSPRDASSDTLDELWSLLETNTPVGEQALTPPHDLCHTAFNALQTCDARSLNQRYRTMAEIYSLWGSSETGCPGSVQNALVYGHRLGFYGSSDTHWAFPGNPQPEPFFYEGAVSGLAAVYAEELSRDNLWQSISQRHTYATEGEHIYLNFSVDDYPMGSEITAASAPHIKVTAAGTNQLAKVEVLKGEYLESCSSPVNIDDYYSVIYSNAPNEMTTSFEINDDTFQGNTFYYVRVTQVDGKRAWSSPVWVDYSSTPNNPPVADIGGPYMGMEDIEVNFDGSASFDPDEDSLDYNWDFGDGSIGSGILVNHVYDLADIYTVTLTVSDGRGGTDTDSTVVTIEEVNDPPTADDQTLSTIQDTAIDFTLTGSDPEEDPLTYLIVNYPIHGTLNENLPDLTYTPNSGFTGVDELTFRVNDGENDSNLAMVTITVTPLPSPNQIQNGGFETDLSFWQLATYRDDEAVLSHDTTTVGIGNASAKIDVLNTAWALRNTQLTQNELSLIEGDIYTLVFWAKASDNRQIRIITRPTTSLWAVFNNFSLDITNTWQRYEIEFIAGGSDTNTTLEFDFGGTPSTVWLDGIELSTN